MSLSLLFYRRFFFICRNWRLTRHGSSQIAWMESCTNTSSTDMQRTEQWFNITTELYPCARTNRSCSWRYQWMWVDHAHCSTGCAIVLTGTRRLRPIPCRQSCLVSSGMRYDCLQPRALPSYRQFQTITTQPSLYLVFFMGK